MLNDKLPNFLHLLSSWFCFNLAVTSHLVQLVLAKYFGTNFGTNWYKMNKIRGDLKDAGKSKLIGLEV